MLSTLLSAAPQLVARVYEALREPRPDDVRTAATEMVTGYEFRGVRPVQTQALPVFVQPRTLGLTFVNLSRGYANQDSYLYLHMFDDANKEMLYSVLTVWDGHGQDGDMLAHAMPKVFVQEIMQGLAMHAALESSGKMLALQHVTRSALAVTNMNFFSYPQAASWHGGAVFVGVVVDWKARRAICCSLGDASAWVLREAPVTATERLLFRDLDYDCKILYKARNVSANMGIENPSYIFKLMYRLRRAGLPGAIRVTRDKTVELAWSPAGFEQGNAVDEPLVVVSIEKDFSVRLNLSELAAAMGDFTLPLTRRPVFHQFSLNLDDRNNYLLLTSDGMTHVRNGSDTHRNTM